MRRTIKYYKVVELGFEKKIQNRVISSEARNLTLAPKAGIPALARV